MKRAHTWSWSVSLGFASLAAANVAPTVVIESAAMRAGTTYMDVVYRVNDPDNATVKVRALAFVNGQRSFANLIKPTTFVEGTGANLGDAIPANTSRTLTWNAGVDWNVTLGQVKFEVLAMDDRGLLPFDWITVPAAEGKAAITVGSVQGYTSKFDALLWQLAGNDPDIRVEAGKVIGTASSGAFAGLTLAAGSSPYPTPTGDMYLLKAMDVMPATVAEYDYAMGAARTPSMAPGESAGRAKKTSYTGVTLIETFAQAAGVDVSLSWQAYGQNPVKALLSPSRPMLILSPDGVFGAYGSYPGSYTDIALSYTHFVALRSDGSVFGMARDTFGYPVPLSIPGNLGVLKAIAAGSNFSVGVRQDGTVVTWRYGISAPAGLSDVVTVAAGVSHAIAIKSDGTAIAIKSDGTDMADPLIAPPAGLTGVVAVSIAHDTYFPHTLALKSDGTVTAWGDNANGQTNVPVGLTGVVAVSAGQSLSMALKSDGTVVAWGSRASLVPSGLTHVTMIDANGVVLIKDAP